VDSVLFWALAKQLGSTVYYDDRKRQYIHVTANHRAYVRSDCEKCAPVEVEA
jgi:hypothetical protein